MWSFLRYLNFKLTIERGADVKKVREGCYGLLEGHEGRSGRLVRAADIKKGLEDGCGLLEGHEGCSGHLVHTRR